MTEGANTVALGTVAPGQSLPATFSVSTPAVAPKGAAETDADYLSRLQSSENQITSVQANLTWNDLGNAVFGPVSATTSVTEQFPIIVISLAAPANADSGDTITYTLTLANSGHALAAISALSITLPDGSVQHPAPLSNTVLPGASTTASVTYAIPADHPNGTISATATATWRDSVPNSYGPLSASASTQVTLPNLAPVVSAGTNQTVPFPNTFPLQGTVTDDGKPVGGQLISTWTQVSGPSPAIFADAHNPQSTVVLNAEGTYVLKLTGNDSQLQSSAEVTITTIRGNKAPVVIVGPDQIIELPTNTASVSGSATDDGLPAGQFIDLHMDQSCGSRHGHIRHSGRSQHHGYFFRNRYLSAAFDGKRFRVERQRRSTGHRTTTQQSSFGQRRPEPDDLPACEYHHLERRRYR